MKNKAPAFGHATIKSNYIGTLIICASVHFKRRSCGNLLPGLSCSWGHLIPRTFGQSIAEQRPHMTTGTCRVFPVNRQDGSLCIKGTVSEACANSKRSAVGLVTTHRLQRWYLRHGGFAASFSKRHPPMCTAPDHAKTRTPRDPAKGSPWLVQVAVAPWALASADCDWRSVMAVGRKRTRRNIFTGV